MTRPDHGICFAGDGTEDLFLSLVPRAKSMPRCDPRGDACIEVDGQLAYVEVKRASHATGAKQVRAIKFIPLVVWTESRGDRPWAVLSAVEVTKLILRRHRGLHTELPLECSLIPPKSIGRRFWHPGADLQDAVIEAVRESRRYPTLATEMARLLTEIRSLRDGHASAVLRAMRSDDPAFQYQLALGEEPC